MEFQKPFDVAITALGWTYDRSILDPSIELAMMGPPWRPKDPHVYPDLTSAFESKTAPHFYVMGSASHGLDRYRYKASGGFIHGFRFNCRAYIYEGALSFVTFICYTYMDYSYKREYGRKKDKIPSSKVGSDPREPLRGRGPRSRRAAAGRRRDR
jgi:hypothetical protein